MYRILALTYNYIPYYTFGVYFPPYVYTFFFMLDKPRDEKEKLFNEPLNKTFEYFLLQKFSSQKIRY
jgi:hypothetical protein